MQLPSLDRRQFLGALGAAPLPPAQEYPRFGIDLESLLDRHDMEWAGYLPGDWMEGAPLGNGDLGAMVHGYPDNLSVTLSKSDVWNRQNDNRSYFPGADFAEFRKTYTDGDWPAYLRLQQEAARSRRTQTLALPHLTSCGRITLHLDGGIKTPGCRLKVKLRSGEAVLTYLDRTVRLVASRKYKLLVVDVDRGGEDPDPADPVLANRYGLHAPLEEVDWSLWRPRLQGCPAPELSATGPIQILTQRMAGGGYSIGVTFTSFEHSRAAALGQRIAGSVSEPKARRFQMLVTVVSSQDAEDTAAECRRRLREALEAGPEAILEAHAAWWRDYWLRGLATVGDEAVEKWYYRSLYLCGCMFEPGRQSPGLQGVWCGENFPRWCADFHSNGNTQALYWGLPANNRLEWMEPYLAYYERIAPVARKVAREYYRMRGLRFPHMGSIGGNELNPPNMLQTDPGGTPWVAQVFWQYFEYSQDREFLAKRAYPILRDAALFCADYLTRDAQGRWTMAPVLHYEARSYSSDQRPEKPPPFEMWGTNSLYAQAMFRAGFHQAIRAAQELGVDEPLQREWQEKLDHLAEPPAAPEGYWKAWENRPPVYGWHNFLLSLAFPAELVSQFHGSPKWFSQAQATWRHMQDNHLPGNSGKAWVGGQGILELHRLGFVEAAFQGARWPRHEPGAGDRVPVGMLVRSDEQQENGMSVNRTVPVLQADHGAGMCRVLAEMLVFGVDGVIHVFSGIPESIPARFHSLLAPGGFLVSGEKRGKSPDYVLVRPNADHPFRLGNIWKQRVSVTDLAGGKAILSTSGPVIEARLQPARDYLVAPAGFRLEQLSTTGFSMPFQNDRQ